MTMKAVDHLGGNLPRQSGLTRDNYLPPHFVTESFAGNLIYTSRLQPAPSTAQDQLCCQTCLGIKQKKVKLKEVEYAILQAQMKVHIYMYVYVCICILQSQLEDSLAAILTLDDGGIKNCFKT